MLGNGTKKTTQVMTPLLDTILSIFFINIMC